MRWSSATKTAIALLAFIQVWLAFVPTISGGVDLKPGEIKVERKPKFISNGAGQKPFDVSRHIVPLSEIQRSVLKNAIPALIHPSFLTADQIGKSLDAKDRVLGIYMNGVAKAYPIRILNWHELVNDGAGGQPILISWCPLCGSGVVYDPVIDGRRHTFGVSGLLFRRNLVLYDVESGSLWSQLMSQAIAGPLAGTRLKLLPVEDTTWGVWKVVHPDTWVLSFVTGFRRDYSVDPYASFPLPRKLALLVAWGEEVKIYPFSELNKEDSPLADHVGDREITITFDRHTQTAHLVNQPAGVYSFVGFLDDLKTFYRGGEVYRRRRR